MTFLAAAAQLAASQPIAFVSGCDLRIKSPILGVRQIPAEIAARGPKGRLADCFQVLVESVGGQVWINVQSNSVWAI